MTKLDAQHAEFCREVRRRREALGLTQDELAGRSGLTPNYIGTIENGKRDPSLSTMQAIAKGLGLPLGELLGPLPEFSTSAHEMARLFEASNGELQTALLAFLRGVVKKKQRA
jgi:transcriptional regulator with XRE-family HTH domain